MACIKKIIPLSAGMAAALALLPARSRAADPDKAAKSAAADKSGGLFPNDLGPKEIDVSKYPKEMQATYKVFKEKCSACHTIARPINTQFLELTPEEMKTAKEKEPELFADDKVIHPEEKIWNRYVKRMMSKPGCPVGRDGKRIYEFLAYDSKNRKTGANRKAWIEHRKKLVEDFKKDHPDDYARIFGKTQ